MKEKQEEFLKRIQDNLLKEKEKTEKDGEIMLRVDRVLGELDLEFIETLFNYLSKRPDIIGINFSRAIFSSEAASQLAEVLRKNTVPIQCISLNNSVFYGDSLNEVINSLSSNNTLQVLRIDKKNFQMSDNDEDLTRILQSRKNTTLCRIVISGAALPKRIENCLSFNKVLKKIKIRWTYNTSLLQAKPRKNVVLQLYRLDLGYEDMKKLAEEIPKDNTLIQIWLNLSPLEKEAKEEKGKENEKKEEIKKKFKEKGINILNIKRKRRRNNVT